jgi:putative tryptophan/tyrosine transport system substrate-binding protein
VIDRRTFLAGTGAVLLAAPLAAEAQQAGKVWRIGFLAAGRSPASLAVKGPFRQGLHDLGYVEGRDFVMEYRYAEGHQDRLPELAADLVRIRADVIVTGGTPATIAAKQATETIPIVFAVAGQVVEKGIVRSLAQPGGNVTGLQLHAGHDKVLQLLKDAVPTVTRVVVLYDPASLPGDVLRASLKLMRSSAQTQNVELQPVAVSDPNGVSKAFTGFGRGTNGLVVWNTTVLNLTAGQIGKLALQRKLPAAGHGRVFADAGCLMSYGENQDDMYRRAAVYVDKILKGAKPAGLPVEQPTKFELVINLKTAKALGLTIPPSLLGRADEVIQ